MIQLQDSQSEQTIEAYCGIYGYMQERHSHSTHTPLIEIIA